MLLQNWQLLRSEWIHYGFSTVNNSWKFVIWLKTWPICNMKSAWSTEDELLIYGYVYIQASGVCFCNS